MLFSSDVQTRTRMSPWNPSARERHHKTSIDGDVEDKNNRWTNRKDGELKKCALWRAGGGVRDVCARSSSEARQGGTLIIGRHLFILPLYNPVKELGRPPRPPPQTIHSEKTCPPLSMDGQSETSEPVSTKSRLQFDFHSSTFKMNKTRGQGKESSVYISAIICIGLVLWSKTLAVKEETAKHAHMP